MKGIRERRDAADMKLTLVPPSLAGDSSEYAPEPAEREVGPVEAALAGALPDLTSQFASRPVVEAVALRMARHLDSGRPDIASAASQRLLELVDRLQPPAVDGGAHGGLKLAALGTPD